MAKVWRCDRWDVVSITTLLILFPLSIQAAQGAITGFALWDAQTETLIDPDFRTGDVIPYAYKNCVAIEIKTNSYLNNDGQPGSIRKRLDNQTSAYENDAPYAYVDETAGNYDCSPQLAIEGQHTLTITPFDGNDMTGLPGTDAVITFTTQSPPPTCNSTGAQLECPGHGTTIRCEIPPDAQAVSDRTVTMRACYVGGFCQNYAATQQFPLNGKVYQDWHVQTTDNIYYATCTNHLLQPPTDGSPQDYVSPPLLIGYSYGQPLPEPNFLIMIVVGAMSIWILSGFVPRQ